MGNPFVHVELNTNNVEKAKKFYGQLFNWEMEDVEMGPSGLYTMIKPGKGTGGGILKHPMQGEPSIWIAYVEVTDIEAATKQAKSLGAKIVREVTEVPGGGWFSIIIDPTGATLGLWKPKAA